MKTDLSIYQTELLRVIKDNQKDITIINQKGEEEILKACVFTDPQLLKNMNFKPQGNLPRLFASLEQRSLIKRDRKYIKEEGDRRIIILL